MLSNIALAAPEKESEEDGFLTAREWFDMTLSAEMVVLSACDTGQGKTQVGEGVQGLTWALFVAGSPTRWLVSGKSTMPPPQI